ATISTATWLPFSCSIRISLASSAACCSWLKVAVRSVTRCVNAGTSCTCAVTPVTENSRPKNSRHSARRHLHGPDRRANILLLSKIHHGRIGYRFFILYRKVGLGLVTEHHGSQVIGE